MTNGAPQPGWYPDPEDESRLRYWDGAAWTDRTGAREPVSQSPPTSASATGDRQGQGQWWRQPITIAGAVALIVALAAGFLVFSVTGEAEAEVVLEPVGQTGVDPFTDSVASEEVAIPGDAAADQGTGLGEVEDPRSEGAETALAGHVATGTAPGLYGGSRDTQVCDVSQLIGFLEDPANASEAEAWAGVHGISVDQIPRYIRNLTAVRLSFATRVTNHGFEGGGASPVQSLLQAGTAVLVDDTGVPRVKCDCGNPLLEPAGEGGGGLDLDQHARNPGDAWEGLDAAQVVAIRPGSEPVEEITLNDFDGDGLLQRPVGSDGASMPDTGTGDVRIKLEWSSDADLDLHVTEPAGTEIYFGAKGPTSTGGRLDVDSNVGCNNTGSIENVFWPPGEGPAGEYVVEVVGFSVSGCGSGEFTLTIEVAGRDPEVHTGSVGEDGTARFSFTVSADGADESGAGEPGPSEEGSAGTPESEDPPATDNGCPPGSEPYEPGACIDEEGNIIPGDV